MTIVLNRYTSLRVVLIWNSKVFDKIRRYICWTAHCKLMNRLSTCALLTSIVYPLTANAIIGGQIDSNTATSPWAGVGSLSVNGGTYTATVIGSRFIITAAHVVDGASAQNVNFNLNVGADLSQSIKASAIHIFPEYHGFIRSVTDGLVHNDLAVIELSSDLPTGLPIYPLLTGLPAPAQTITMVGYGKSGNGVNGATISGAASVKRVGENQVDRFFKGANGNTDMYMFDFDGSTSATNVMGFGALTNEAQFGSGDSGSPAFIQHNGVWQILGVNTFVATAVEGADYYKFGALGGGTLISAYADWIQGIVTVPQRAVFAASVKAPPVSVEMLLSGGVLLLWVARRRRDNFNIGNSSENKISNT
jgi:secreted trypsin-like serine protease